MKVSTKGRYGIRIMLELALHYEQDLVTVRSLAQKQGISEKYIEQIISLFNKAGLVRSQRGAAGGYRLASEPSSITMGQILRITEGGLVLVDYGGTRSSQCFQEESVTAEFWDEVRESVSKVVDTIMLSTLVERYHEKTSSCYDYII